MSNLNGIGSLAGLTAKAPGCPVAASGVGASSTFALDVAPSASGGRDASGLAFALVLAVVVAAVFVAAVRYARRRSVPRADVQTPDGAVVPKCRYCDEPAARRPYQWIRGEGMLDLIRRRFGAPGRVRVGRDDWAELEVCAVHDPLVREEYRLENTEYELDRAKLESEWETRRARFQREGIHERVTARIEKHQREIGGRKRKSEAPAKVVPITRNGTS